MRRNIIDCNQQPPRITSHRGEEFFRAIGIRIALRLMDFTDWMWILSYEGSNAELLSALNDEIHEEHMSRRQRECLAACELVENGPLSRIVFDEKEAA